MRLVVKVMGRVLTLNSALSGFHIGCLEQRLHHQLPAPRPVDVAGAHQQLSVESVDQRRLEILLVALETLGASTMCVWRLVSDLSTDINQPQAQAQAQLHIPLPASLAVLQERCIFCNTIRALSSPLPTKYKTQHGSQGVLSCTIRNAH